MSETVTVSPATDSAAGAPRVGFVSLGCPKALTDSELILTQLSAEGYRTSKTFEGADLVIVNTCGFIDEAAGVHDHEIRAFEGLRSPVAFGRQLREDQLGIGQGLRTAQADKADTRCAGGAVGGR